MRQRLHDVACRRKRNKAQRSLEGWYVAAIDGHEFFSSRTRCCVDCQQRTVTVNGEAVTEYDHQGVVCHLIGRDLALVLDVELLRPGEGEKTAAKRLLQRVFADYPRSFDIVVGDAWYVDAPFLNFCRDHRTHGIVTAKGDHRLLLQEAQGLFSQQQPGCWIDWNPKRSVRSWDEEGFTSCEGTKEPLRVMRTEETVRRRQGIAGRWHETDETATWSWATTLSKTQLSTRGLWRCGHGRWDVENDCFNTLAAPWGLDHCFKHGATAIVNFLLTSFIVSAMQPSFWLRNLKPAVRAGLTLIGLARELDRGLVGCRAPWYGLLVRGP